MQKARHYCWILAGLSLAACSKSSSSDDDNNGNWINMFEMSGKPRSEAVAFTINDTAYVGTGYDGEKYLKDFWKYDVVSGWTQIADLPGVERVSATAMVIANKGYVGTGFDGLNRLNDFYAYSPATGAWEPKAPLVGSNPAISLARKDAVSFSLKGMGYIATGNDGGALKDVYMYNPATDSWSTKATFIGSKRTEAVAFVLGDSAYIATGINNSELKNDFWVYHPDTDTWVEKRKISNFSDDDYDNDYDIMRSGGTAFVMNNKAYVCTGVKSGLAGDVWEYDPVNDLWTKKRDFEGIARTGGVAFTLGGKGYVGTGRTSSLPLDNFFRFDPDAEYNAND